MARPQSSRSRALLLIGSIFCPSEKATSSKAVEVSQHARRARTLHEGVRRRHVKRPPCQSRGNPVHTRICTYADNICTYALSLSLTLSLFHHTLSPFSLSLSLTLSLSLSLSLSLVMCLWSRPPSLGSTSTGGESRRIRRRASAWSGEQRSPDCQELARWPALLEPSRAETRCRVVNSRHLGWRAGTGTDTGSGTGTNTS